MEKPSKEEIMRVAHYEKMFTMIFEDHLATVDMLDDLWFTLVGAPFDYPKSTFYEDHGMLSSQKHDTVESKNEAIENVFMEIIHLHKEIYPFEKFEEEHPFDKDVYEVLSKAKELRESTTPEKRFFMLRDVAIKKLENRINR